MTTTPSRLDVTARPSLSSPDGLIVSVNGEEAFYLRVVAYGGKLVVHLLDRRYRDFDEAVLKEVTFDG